MNVRRRNRHRKRTPVLAIATVLTVAVLVLQPTAALAGVPQISAFVATPASVTTTKGLVTLSATVAHGMTCSLSVEPAVSGLPITGSCTDFAEQVELPLNSGSVEVSYSFTLSAAGKKETSTAQTIVTVAPGAGWTRTGECRKCGQRRFRRLRSS